MEATTLSPGEALPATAPSSILDLPAFAIQSVIMHLQDMRDVYSASLACKAWARLPQQRLTSLCLKDGRSKFRIHPPMPPVEQLQHCCNLAEITVENSRHAAWQAAAVQLSQHRLPRLRQLVFSYACLDVRALEELNNIMQVQPAGCHIRLAATDREAVAALAAVKVPSLAHISANVADLTPLTLEHLYAAAALQGPRCSISVWVCCWGGCKGLSMDAAQALHTRLPAEQLTGLQMVAIPNGQEPDMQQLAKLTQLSTLGIAFDNALRASHNDSSNSQTVAAVAAPVSLEPLAALSERLMELNIEGCGTNGWSGAAALSALTRLTKLQLLPGSGTQALPLAPVAALAGSLQELAVQQEYSGWAELQPLGALTRLKRLRLELHSWAIGAAGSARRSSNMDGAAAGCDETNGLCWLAGLTQLESASIAVPHLNLAHLPPSLVELDLRAGSLVHVPGDDAALGEEQAGVHTGTSSRHPPSELPHLPRLCSCIIWTTDKLHSSRYEDILDDLMNGCPNLQLLEVGGWALRLSAILHAAAKLHKLRMLLVGFHPSNGVPPHLDQELAALKTAWKRLTSAGLHIASLSTQNSYQ